MASAELIEQRKSPDASYSVNGENPALTGDSSMASTCRSGGGRRKRRSNR
jgi:hypothetical protein